MDPVWIERLSQRGEHRLDDASGTWGFAARTKLPSGVAQRASANAGMTSGSGQQRVLHIDREASVPAAT
jgi:hypothetical protein